MRRFVRQAAATVLVLASVASAAYAAPYVQVRSVDTSFLCGGSPYGIAADAFGAVYATFPTSFIVGQYAGSSLTTYLAPVRYPYGITVDQSGFIWCTQESGVAEYNTSGSQQDAIYNSASVVGGVTVDSAGQVWLTAPDEGHFEAWNNLNSGTWQESVSVSGDHPTGIAHDAANHIYVCFTGSANTVREYANDGAYMKSFGSGLSQPNGVAVDPSGNVWIADSGNDRVLEYSNSGAMLTTISNLHYPTGLCFDPAGNLWVADNGVNQLIEFQPAIAGDANGDGKVDINDLSVVLTNYDRSGINWAQGDFNGDGTVNISDLSNVLTNYDKTAGATAGFRAVPEPTSLSLLVMLVVALLGGGWQGHADRTRA
jgi:streptogramin lyase